MHDDTAPSPTSKAPGRQGGFLAVTWRGLVWVFGSATLVNAAYAAVMAFYPEKMLFAPQIYEASALIGWLVMLVAWLAAAVLLVAALVTLAARLAQRRGRLRAAGICLKYGLLILVGLPLFVFSAYENLRDPGDPSFFTRPADAWRQMTTEGITGGASSDEDEPFAEPLAAPDAARGLFLGR